MNLILRHFIGLWIWTATLVVIVPGEFVHFFMGHEDTKDEAHLNGEKSYEMPHVHCFILKAQLQEYIIGYHPDKTCEIPLAAHFLCIYQSPLIPYHPFSVGLRAPPLVSL